MIDFEIPVQGVCSQRCAECPFGPRPALPKDQLQDFIKFFRESPDSEVNLCHRHRDVGSYVICAGFMESEVSTRFRAAWLDKIDLPVVEQPAHYVNDWQGMRAFMVRRSPRGSITLK